MLPSASFLIIEPLLSVSDRQVYRCLEPTSFVSLLGIAQSRSRFELSLKLSMSSASLYSISAHLVPVLPSYQFAVDLHSRSAT